MSEILLFGALVFILSVPCGIVAGLLIETEGSSIAMATIAATLLTVLALFSVVPEMPLKLGCCASGLSLVFTSVFTAPTVYVTKAIQRRSWVRQGKCPWCGGEIDRVGAVQCAECFRKHAESDKECPRCGYNLVKSRRGCPECGWNRSGNEAGAMKSEPGGQGKDSASPD